MRLIVNVPREKVAEYVVLAVRKNRNHVRIPQRAIGFPLLTEAPRRATEILLTGIPHQAR
jgi:uncharacterized protein